MITTIDCAGRIVIPKALRDATGLHGQVEVEASDGVVQISPVARKPVRNAGGKLRLPITGERLGVDTVREARLSAQR
jgi:AbrB family looped-hinge helix DNA binding protein